VWNDDLPGLYCFQNTLLRLRPRGDTDPRFLAWWCRHAFASGEFASIAAGANIFHLSAERVRSLAMTYVIPEEQRAIADYLDRETARIDALIAAKQRARRLLDERFTAMRDATIARLDGPSIKLGRFVRSIGQGFSPQAED
jgi:type I restriction enzyme S subunit